MAKSNLDQQKLLEEIKGLQRPWYKKVDSWVAITAIASSIAAFSFQYSLHDKSLLVARAEKSLALEEKTKAENEKYFVIRERITLAEKTEKFQKEIKVLVEKHNKAIAAIQPMTKETKELIDANNKFIGDISEKQINMMAKFPTSGEKFEYYSIIDQIIRIIIQIFGWLLFIIAA